MSDTAQVTVDCCFSNKNYRQLCDGAWVASGQATGRLAALSWPYLTCRCLSSHVFLLARPNLEISLGKFSHTHNLWSWAHMGVTWFCCIYFHQCVKILHTWQFCEKVTFFGWWKRDPLKGCWWPPTKGSKGHELKHLALIDTFWCNSAPQDGSHAFRHYSWQLNSAHGRMFRCRGLGSMSIPLKLYRAYKLTISIFSIFFSTIWKHCSGLLGTCIFQRNISENENYCQALAGLSALLTRHVDKPRGFKTCTSWMQHEPWIHGSYQYEPFLVCGDTWLDHVWW